MSHNRRQRPSFTPRQQNGHRQHEHHGGRSHHRGGDEDHIPPEYLRVVKSFGTSIEDIERWREERKRKFPRTSMPKEITAVSIHNNTATESSRSLSLLGSHFAAYATDDDEEDDEARDVPKVNDVVHQEDQPTVLEELLNVKSPIAVDNSQPVVNVEHHQGGRRVCAYFSMNGHCRYGNKCRNEHLKQDGDDQQKPKQARPSATGIGNSNLKTQKELVECLVGDVCEDDAREEHGLVTNVYSKQQKNEESRILLECFAYIVANRFFDET
jgi:hypothetical protein